jgi:hypothetical protein
MQHATASSFLGISGVVWFWLLTIVGVGGVVFSLSRRFSLLKTGRADDRFDRWGERIKHTLVYAIGQKTDVRRSIRRGLPPADLLRLPGGQHPDRDDGARRALRGMGAAAAPHRRSATPISSPRTSSRPSCSSDWSSRSGAGGSSARNASFNPGRVDRHRSHRHSDGHRPLVGGGSDRSRRSPGAFFRCRPSSVR